MFAQRKKYKRDRDGCGEKPENTSAVFLKDRPQKQIITPCGILWNIFMPSMQIS